MKLKPNTDLHNLLNGFLFLCLLYIPICLGITANGWLSIIGIITFVIIFMHLHNGYYKDRYK